MQRHRHMEFIRFHNAVEREVRAEKPIHGARQLCHRQASQSAGLALPRSALDLTLHPDLRLLAECGRELLYTRSLGNAFADASSVRLSTSRPPSMLISPAQCQFQ